MIYLWGANMCLVYPWYTLCQPNISLVYLEALVHTRDIPSICQLETRKIINGFKIPDECRVQSAENVTGTFKFRTIGRLAGRLGAQPEIGPESADM